MPNHVKFLPLDQTRLRGNSYLESHEMRAKVAAAGTNRPVSVIRWAHHDDGHYLGRPYLPNATFCTKLNGARSAGFGIIHWTTRPLDLYFDSLSRQTWQSTRDESIQDTCRDMATRCFGPDSAGVMSRYLHRWLTEAPAFSRETGPHFFDPRHEVADPVKLEPQTKERLALLQSVAPSTLTREQRARLSYFKGLERFILDAHRVETAYRRAAADLKKGRTAGARAAIEKADPAPVIEHFARFSQLGGISRGEQGTVVSMNTRWLPHVVRLRQQLGLTPVRYNFGPTSHEPLAQMPGRYTFHFDRAHNLWQTLGEEETGAAAFVLSKDATIALPKDAPPAWAEIGRSGIESSQPISLTVGPILTAGDLLAGRYRLTLLTIEPTATGPNQRVFDVVVGSLSESVRRPVDRAAASKQAPDRVDLFKLTGGRHRLLALRYCVDLKQPGVVPITLKPLKGKAILCGMVLTANED